MLFNAFIKIYTKLFLPYWNWQLKSNFFSFMLFTASCGGYLNGNNGTFTSPNYPNKYGNNRQCSWIIEVPEYHKIELTFQNFSVEEGFDFVEVFDGKTLASKSFGKFNNDQKPPVITSTANTMRITLISDISNSFEGFLAKYKASKLILLYFFWLFSPFIILCL